MNIAVSSPLFSRTPLLVEELKKSFLHVKLNTTYALREKSALIDFLKDADAAIVGNETVNEEVLSHCPNLKIVSRYGVGLDNIDTQALEKRGIQVGWSGGTNKNSVAEITLGFMLTLTRNLYPSIVTLKNGEWKTDGGSELTGKTIGIFGFGHIAKRLIELLKPFECTILVSSKREDAEEAQKLGVVFAPFERILTEADIISLHIPLTHLTRNLFSTEAFKAMKKSAFIINTARGGIIDEEALKNALQNQEIAGAALDVFTEEPMKDKSLLALPNLLCTPHFGGNSKESVLAMGRSSISHLHHFFYANGG
jgi:phosphoglycerate dehydrogenase-like enzyme